MPSLNDISDLWAGVTMLLIAGVAAWVMFKGK